MAFTKEELELLEKIVSDKVKELNYNPKYTELLVTVMGERKNVGKPNTTQGMLRAAHILESAGWKRTMADPNPTRLILERINCAYE